VKNILFPDDRYDTPESTPRALGNRLLLGSRWWFYFHFLKIIFRSRSYAVKGIYNDDRWIEASFDIFKTIEKAGGRFHLKGLDNLRNTEGPLLFISNHMSSLETVVFPCIIAPFHSLTFVVKEELVHAKVFGPVMRSRNPIVVGRSDPRRDLQAVLTKGIELLQQGCSIVIFPQSTRHAEFDPQKFNSLGVKLALRAGAKVIPVAIKTDFWANGKRLKDFGPIDPQKPIHMVFGKPLSIHGNGSEQHQYIVDFIQTNLNKWSKEI
jgi:1-acyl-sn-glycerol-3-phosphate acyltransferase